jgi:hypothetical protein
MKTSMLIAGEQLAASVPDVLCQEQPVQWTHASPYNGLRSGRRQNDILVLFSRYCVWRCSYCWQQLHGTYLNTVLVTTTVYWPKHWGQSDIGPAYYTDLNLDVRPFVAGRCAQSYFVENVVYSYSFLTLLFVYFLFGGGIFSLLPTRRDRLYFRNVKFNSLTFTCNFCDDCRDCEGNEVLVCAELFLH